MPECKENGKEVKKMNFLQIYDENICKTGGLCTVYVHFVLICLKVSQGLPGSLGYDSGLIIRTLDHQPPLKWMSKTFSLRIVYFSIGLAEVAKSF